MKKYLLPLILILLVTFTLIGNCGWLSGYDQRIKLTIDNTKVDAALSNFPVTIFFTLAQGEEIFTEFDADSDYMKCAFTASDGTTQLYAEKELFALNTSSQFPPAQSDTYVKSTSKSTTSYWAYYATDPAKSLTGGSGNNSWFSGSSLITNQRFHIDLGSAKAIKRIYYENSHHSGTEIDRGVQNFTFWGSNTGAGTFDDLVYANDEGWTQLTISQSTFDQHTASDVADPKYITVTNTTAYRYYAFKFADNYGDANYMGVRRIELQAGGAIYHVKVSSISSSADTDIYYYYDNDHADNTTYIGAINTTAGGHVWDANFKAVYHMVDATTSTVVDSTSNNNDGTKKAANEPIEATGKIWKGQDFDGTDDYIEVDDSVSLNLDGASLATFEFLVNVCNYLGEGTVGERFLIKSATSTGPGDAYELALCTDNHNLVLRVSGLTLIEGTQALSLDTYYHVALIYDGTQSEGSRGVFYIDGSADSVTSDDLIATLPDSADSLKIGGFHHDATNRHLNGLMDEVRISDTNRSAAWIKATYNSSWDSLLTYGSEETSAEDNAVFFGTNF